MDYEVDVGGDSEGNGILIIVGNTTIMEGDGTIMCMFDEFVTTK